MLRCAFATMGAVNVHKIQRVDFRFRRPSANRAGANPGWNEPDNILGYSQAVMSMIRTTRWLRFPPKAFFHTSRMALIIH
jgi:hypothetical protein